MTPERIADIRASALIVLRNGVYQETAKHQAKLTLECLDDNDRLRGWLAWFLDTYGHDENIEKAARSALSGKVAPE